MHPEINSAALSRSVDVSAPGKLILIGEHAAVYGRPALVATLGLRVTARFRPGDAAGVNVDLPALGLSTALGWGDVVEAATRARERWLRYEEEPTVAHFAALGAAAGLEEPAASVVVIALGEALEQRGLSSVAPGNLPPLSLRIDSQIPLGSGFGSSAAVAVGVVAGLFEWLEEGAAADRERISQAALDCERRQHGLPSGVDHSTVLQGGIALARASHGQLRLEPGRGASRVARPDTGFDTGRPRETTGEVVAAVQQLRERDRSGFDRRLDRMQRLVDALAGACGAAGPGDRDPTPVVWREYQACLEELGVVPEAVRRSIAGLAAAGYSAKVSGAGALSGPCAGSVLVYDPGVQGAGPGQLIAPAPEVSARLGGPGLTVEIVE